MKKIDINISSDAYKSFLIEVVNIVQSHRVQAVQSVQRISNQLYWNIGELIIEKQKEYGWGKSVIERLSVDLINLLGDSVSWSPRNLLYMKQIVSEYSNLNQLGSHLDKNHKNLNGNKTNWIWMLDSLSVFKKIKERNSLIIKLITNRKALKLNQKRCIIFLF